jgi:hypothetical protein
VEKSVSIRMGTTGKADVTRTFDEIAASGDASAKRWSKAYERAGEDVEAAIQRQANAAAKIAAIAPQSPVQMRIADTNGTGFGQWEGSARQSAAAFKDLIAAEEQLDARTRALVSAIDPAFAAQQRYNAEMRDAVGLYDAGRISLDQFLAAEQQAAAVLDKVAGITRTAAAETAELTAMQARVEAASGTGFGQWEGSAKRSALAMGELLAEEERLEARTRALIAAIDPAAAAQMRFDAEMATARELISRGAISLDQYVAKLRLEQDALDDATAAHMRANVSTGQLRAGGQQLAYQIGDITQQWALNTPLMVIFAQQGGQVVQALDLMTGGANRFISFMAGTWGAVLLGAVMIIGQMVSRSNDAGNAADELAKRQQSLSGIIDKTTGRIKEQNAALLQNAILAARKDVNETRKAYIEARTDFVNTAVPIPGLAQLQQQFARGEKSAAQVSSELANLTREFKYGTTGYKQVEYLQGLLKSVVDTARTGVSAQAQSRLLGGAGKPGDAAIAFGDFSAGRNEPPNTAILDAQARLQAGNLSKLQEAQEKLTIAREKAKDELDKGIITQDQYTARLAPLEAAVNAAREKTDRHGQSLARQAAAMDVNAQASLDLARAYLVGGDAALRAEAARKGLTDATRRGIDTDAQVQRQLQVMVGEQVANGAKSVAQLREETEARAAVRAQVLAGTLPVEGMAQALSDEAALRPLLKLQTVAQGEALTELTKVIEAYRKALADAHEEEAKSSAAVETKASTDRFAETIESIRDLGKDPLQRALDAARRAAERDADAKKLTGEDRTGFVDARINEARATEGYRRAQFYVSTADDQRDSLEMAKLDLSLASAGNDERDRAVSKLDLILRMKREGITADSEEGRKLLENQEHLDGVATQAKLAAAGFQELRDFGSDFVDTVLSEDTWSSWGNAGKTILNMLKSEFVKLALLNPIKNLLNGDRALPTLSGLVGKVGSLFGKPGNNAAGTEWWSGGATYLAEHGPELVNLPQGSRVTPAGETRRLLGGGGMMGGEMKLKLELTPSSYFDARVVSVSGPLVAQGATAAAAGGAQMAEAESMAAGARRLGRFR